MVSQPRITRTVNEHHREKYLTLFFTSHAPGEGEGRSLPHPLAYYYYYYYYYCYNRSACYFRPAYAYIIHNTHTHCSNPLILDFQTTHPQYSDMTHLSYKYSQLFIANMETEYKAEFISLL